MGRTKLVAIKSQFSESKNPKIYSFRHKERERRKNLDLSMKIRPTFPAWENQQIYPSLLSLNMQTWIWKTHHLTSSNGTIYYFIILECFVQHLIFSPLLDSFKWKRKFWVWATHTQNYTFSSNLSRQKATTNYTAK